MKKSFLDVSCTYCGAGVGEKCVLVLEQSVGPLSIQWQHRTREALAIAS
jgi:hypothetical protein